MNNGPRSSYNMLAVWFGANRLMKELALDQDGHLCDHQLWTPEVAAQLAANSQLVLTDEHLAILQAVRLFYDKFGYAPATRPLIRFVMQQCGASYDNARLMQLFDTGLVARVLCRLAGLPKPANCL